MIFVYFVVSFSISASKGFAYLVNLRSQLRMADYSALLPVLNRVWDQTAAHRVLQPDGCITTTYADAGKGYVQVRFSGKKYYLHIVAAMKQANRAPSTGDEASHLCHNTSCVNPQHLTLENGFVNKSRLCCQLYGKTPKYLCPHTPVCFDCNSLFTAD